MIEVHEKSRLARMRAAAEAVEAAAERLRSVIARQQVELQDLEAMGKKIAVLSPGAMEEVERRLREKGRLREYLALAERKRKEWQEDIDRQRTRLVRVEARVSKLASVVENLEDRDYHYVGTLAQREWDLRVSKAQLAVWVGDPPEADRRLAALLAEMAEHFETLPLAYRSLGGYKREADQEVKRLERLVEEVTGSEKRE